MAATSASPCYTTDEIRNYYFPPGNGSGSNDSAGNDGLLFQHREPKHISRARTLHDSASRPGQLSHVLLFRGAHPRWSSSGGTIYVKSGLGLLPIPLSPGTTGMPAIAIFSQAPASSLRPPPLRFRFLGYFTIADVRMLQLDKDGDGAELKALFAAKEEEAAALASARSLGIEQPQLRG
ncbi:hypothetical protein DV737_g3455, partial [Chaetothyriales sp. CBS 132003]